MTEEQRQSLADAEVWLFDLDNTLYPAECRLFDQIDQRMGSFIADAFDVDRAEARRIQKDYFFRYGTTLRGLMSELGDEYSVGLITNTQKDFGSLL
ncbi:MAG: hypothetical protein ABFS30_11345, partial [Pseudomonadota bacterium]